MTLVGRMTLIERLRTARFTAVASLTDEAADRIEFLEEGLREIGELAQGGDPWEAIRAMRSIARKALAGEKP